MHERFENQYLNRTTAEAAVRMLERLDTGGLLPAERRKLVEEAMIASRTGSRRIRSVLPGDVVAGDKTGSSLRSAEGMTAADNDLAFVRLPDGTTYYMAVLVANSFEDDRTNERRRGHFTNRLRLFRRTGIKPALSEPVPTDNPS